MFDLRVRFGEVFRWERSNVMRLSGNLERGGPERKGGGGV